jgi:hypothetical protein
MPSNGKRHYVHPFKYQAKAYTHPAQVKRPKLLDLKERFDDVNFFVTQRDGFVTSVPGDRTVTIEVPETSDLPKQLASRGYSLREVWRRDRLVPNAKIEEVIAGKKMARTLSHPGLVAVIGYEFEL